MSSAGKISLGIFFALSLVLVGLFLLVLYHPATGPYISSGLNGITRLIDIIASPFGLIWLVSTIVTAAVGSARRGGVAAWFFLGLLLGPIGALIAIVAKPRRSCPFCCKGVDERAVKCAYCQSELEAHKEAVGGHQRF